MAAITKEGHPENPKVAKEASNSLASLQVLTSSIPPTLNVEKASIGSKVEVKAKRTRKKKAPSKVSQKPILPKMFAIQIAPQASVIAPLPPIMNPAVIQTSARLAGPVTFQQQTHVLPVTDTKTMAVPSDPATCSKTLKKGSKQAKTREESIELAGKFHYASNGKEPVQCESEDLVLNSGGLPARHRSRLVHNATEKRRKEKINGWIGKIATVLFKYSPEKQHKIYILEKAYDFIAEKNSPRLGTNDTSGNEKQDAFTQSESANEDTLPDLVAKIAELENLVSTLLKNPYYHNRGVEHSGLQRSSFPWKPQ